MHQYRQNQSHGFQFSRPPIATPLGSQGGNPEVGHSLNYQLEGLASVPDVTVSQKFKNPCSNFEGELSPPVFHRQALDPATPQPAREVADHHDE